MSEIVAGIGSVAVWDQRLAEAIDRLKNSDGFILYTLKDDHDGDELLVAGSMAAKGKVVDLGAFDDLVRKIDALV